MTYIVFLIKSYLHLLPSTYIFLHSSLISCQDMKHIVLSVFVASLSSFRFTSTHDLLTISNFLSCFTKIPCSPLSRFFFLLSPFSYSIYFCFPFLHCASLSLLATSYISLDIPSHPIPSPPPSSLSTCWLSHLKLTPQDRRHSAPLQ